MRRLVFYGGLVAGEGAVGAASGLLLAGFGLATLTFVSVVLGVVFGAAYYWLLSDWAEV